MSALTNPNDWMRIGKGRRFQFELSFEKFLDVIIVETKKHEGDWKLISCNLQPSETGYQNRSCVLKINELGHYITNGHWDFFLTNLDLTPELLHIKASDIDEESALSLSGLVNIRYGQPSKKKGQETPQISMVDKVFNKKSGEIIEYKEYLKVFTKLKSSIKNAAALNQNPTK